MAAFINHFLMFLCLFCAIFSQITCKVMFPEDLLNAFQHLDEKTIERLTNPTDMSHIQKICKNGYTKDVNGKCVEEAEVEQTVIEIIDVVKLDCKKGFKKIRGKCRKEYDDFKSKLAVKNN